MNTQLYDSLAMYCKKWDEMYKWNHKVGFLSDSRHVILTRAAHSP